MTAAQVACGSTWYCSATCLGGAIGLVVNSPRSRRYQAAQTDPALSLELGTDGSGPRCSWPRLGCAGGRLS
jgi:hypothetical protein